VYFTLLSIEMRATGPLLKNTPITFENVRVRFVSQAPFLVYCAPHNAPAVFVQPLKGSSRIITHIL
jgi:hypothetical protein